MATLKEIHNPFVIYCREQTVRPVETALRDTKSHAPMTPSLDSALIQILGSHRRTEFGKHAVSHVAGSDVKKTIDPKRVLIIEDNLDSVQSMVLLLRDMGHKVEYALDGYAGIEAAWKFRPEFILLDLGLPGLDGFDVCRRLKRDLGLAYCRVIAITGYAEDEYRIRSKAAGCELHLIKPVPARVLEELLG
jgi:CheY-like chemotaxis protein